MGSKPDSTTKLNVKESPSRKSSSSMFTSRQRTASTADALNTSLGNVLRQLENFSPSSKKARPDENVPPGRSIFSCKVPMVSALLPQDGSSAPSPRQARETTPQRGSSVARDDFWEALRSHYNYLMDEGLIATCREASDELSWEEEGGNQTCCWSFTEFIQKFNELHDALHKLQSDVVAASETSEDKSNKAIGKVVFEKLQLAVYGCKLFKEQANQLGRRYPDMKDEINRRVILLANKWEAVEQAINPHKTPPKEGGIFQEVAHEMRCLRRWLRELEERLHPLTIQPNWTLEDLEEKYRHQLSLQKEIESRGKFVSSLLKLCDQLGEGEVLLTSLGTTLPEQHKSASNSDEQSPPIAQHQQPWDAHRFRRVAANLEKRWHAIWLRSLEWQCLLEELIEKYRAGNVPAGNTLDISLCEEPLTKYPRLGNDWDEFPWVGKMNHQPSDEPVIHDSKAPSPTFSSSSEAGQPISQLHQGSSTTDRGVMVGTTGIAQLKAECGGSFGRFEIVQDVGYSSESSTQLSNDEKPEFIRIYSYSPVQKGRTLINEYKVSGDELFGTMSPTLHRQADVKMVPERPSVMVKEDMSAMDWQFTSEDEDFDIYPFDDHHPPLRRSPISHSSPLNRKTLKSELEDVDGSILEAWVRKDQFESDSEYQAAVESVPHSELETSAVTLVGSDPNDSLVDNNVEMKEVAEKTPEGVKSKEDSRKRSAGMPAVKLDLDKQSPGLKQGVVKDSTLKSARVKEWLKGCRSDETVASGAESNVEEDGVEEWPVVASVELSRPVGTVVDSSCDASGEYTTNDEDGSNSDGSQGVNESLALSRSGTGSVETVVPLGRTEDSGTASRVVLRSKKRSTRGDRPWSVTELHHLTSQLGLNQLSTSEGALNTLIHSSSASSVRTKLFRGSSPPKSKRHSQPSTAQSQQQLGNYSSQTLPLRRSRRHRSRGSLHLSPTSPYAPSLIGAPPGGPTPSGTSTANTDSGSDGLSPASGLSSTVPGSSILGQSISDSAHYSSSTGGVTSTGSQKHSGSSGSKSNRRRRSSPANRSLGKKKSSPKTSNLDLTQLKGTLANLNRESRKTTPELKLEEVEKLNPLVPPTEDQSSVSDQVWDGYEDPPYLSEPYSEHTADEDQVKKLLNFGDDYRAFIGSHSDTSSSIGGPKDDSNALARNRSGTIIPLDLRDDSDSDSDVEELQHIMGESLRALQFAENSMHQYKEAIPPTESAELLATCQTNLKCLQVIAEHLDSGLGLRNFTSDDLFHLQELIGGWEMLQTVVLSSQTNGQQYKDVQLEINELRNKMTELAIVANSTCKPFLAMDDLEKRITSLQASLSTLHETKATLLAVNLKVHRLLTDAGLTLSGLKDDVTDLYCQWDDVYELSGSQLSELQAIHGIWVRFNQRRSKLIEILENEELLQEEGGQSSTSPDPYRQLAERSSKSNEAQELLIGLHQDARTLEPHLDSPTGVWSTVSHDLEALGTRVNKMQVQVAAACRRQSLGETPLMAGHPSLNLAEQSPTLQDTSINTIQLSSTTILEEDELTSTETTIIEEPETSTLAGRLESVPTEVETKATAAPAPAPGRPRRSRLWRIFRASLPIQMALVLLYCLAWLLEPHCCDALNNLNFSFTPTLRYIKGPPPV